MATLYLVRHGETKLNTGEEKFRGWKNVPLDENGRADATHLGELFATRALSHIFSSDLDRAHDTAKAIAKPHQMDVTAHPALRPWNLGNLEGQPVSEHKKTLQDLSTRTPDKPAGGDGETFHQFVDRWGSTFKHLQDVAGRSPHPVVAVTHVRDIQVAKSFVTGDHSFIDWTSHSHLTQPGGVATFSTNSKGVWQFKSHNKLGPDTQHF